MNDPLQGINPPESNGMAIAALVIGIGSMVLAIIPIVGFLSWILSPLAIILGAIAMRKTVGKGLAIGGIITGVIGVLICIAWVALFGAAMSAMPEGGMQEIQAELERAAAEAERTAQSGESSGDYHASPANAAGDTAAQNAGTGAGAGAGTGAGTSGGK